VSHVTGDLRPPRADELDVPARRRARRAVRVVSAALVALALAACKVGELLSPSDDGPDPALTVQPAVVVDSAVAGVSGVTMVRLSIAPAAGESREWTAAVRAASAWLHLGASRGTAPGELALELDPTGLEPGSYGDTVDIAIAGAQSEGSSVPVSLLVVEGAVVGQPDPPGTPADAGQFEADGVTPIPVGGVAASTSVVFRARLSDPDPGATVRLEVDIVPVTAPYLGGGTARSAPVSAGSTASVRFDGLAPGTGYRWLVRALDETGRASDWVFFGGNADTDVDFRTPVL
jgi:hypothetical protein